MRDAVNALNWATDAAFVLLAIASIRQYLRHPQRHRLDLAGAIRTALDSPQPDYSRRARALLEPFSRAALDEALRDRVIPRLLPGWTQAPG